MVLVLVALALYASVVATSSAFMPNQASLPDNGDTVRRTADANPWGEDPNRLTALRLVVTALTLVVAGTASVQIGDYISVPPVAIVLILGGLVVLCTEALPSKYGRSKGVHLPVHIVLPARALDAIFGPVVRAVATLTASIYEDANAATDKVSREEIVKLLDGSQTERLDPEDRQMIQRILELPETDVSDCMTPL